MSEHTAQGPRALLGAPFQIGSVVVGEDGSAGSSAALRWAARHVTTDIHVVRAVSPSLELLEAGFQVESTPLLDEAERGVEAALAAVIDPPATVVRHVIEDAPPNALLEAAHRFGVDAIVVGSNGHERFGHLVGANAGRLLHMSDVAVIVVPEDALAPESGDAPPDDVVIGVSGDVRTDAQLVDWVKRVTRAPAPFRLLHAISPTLLAIVPTTTGTEVFEGRARELLDGLMVAGDEWASSVVVDHPVPALVAASTDASMIVVGSHRSSRMTGFLTGSIAQHLPTLSACPVAIVPVIEQAPPAGSA
jgi:nucleotide-binding universal stress UspA family protein